MANFNSVAKRKRELAKLDKRQAKDQRRALRRAERSAVSTSNEQAPVTAAAQSVTTGDRATPGTVPARQPLTLAEAVERWKNTKVAKPKRR